jgi:hypothetical protein
VQERRHGRHDLHVTQTETRSAYLAATLTEETMTMNRTNRLRAMRGPGESYSDVILRIAAEVTHGWTSGQDNQTTACVHQKDDFNSVAKLARSGNRFERRMPKAESCARILSLAFFGITN